MVSLFQLNEIRLDGGFHCPNSVLVMQIYVWMVVFTVPTRFWSCKYTVPSASAETLDSSVSPWPGSVDASMQQREASGQAFGALRYLVAISSHRSSGSLVAASSVSVSA